MLAGDPPPGVIQDHLDLFKGFQLLAYYILKTLLICLSDAAGISGPLQRFESYHNGGGQSRSTLVFLHHPPSEQLQD